jgi:hypothetical protein
VIGYWVLFRRKLEEVDTEVVIAEPALASAAVSTELSAGSD